MSGARPLTIPALAALPGVRHGFFTRAGGVSTGLYAGLNCGLGSRDDPAAVATNRRVAATTLGLAEDALVTVYQVHGNAVARVERPWPPGEAPRADAMVSTTAGVALGILTADCAPLLMADSRAGVIGAAHAGWRGARAGVAEAAIAAMIDLGARAADIIVAIGPAISHARYQVGADFRDSFLTEAPDNARHFGPGPDGSVHFDLTGYLVARLARLGLGAVIVEGSCTAAEPERFYSYRRSCQLGEPDYGRLVSAIALV